MTERVDVRALYQSDAEFRDQVDRVAAMAGDTANEVLLSLEKDGSYQPRAPLADLADVAERELALRSKPLPTSPIFRPGQRRPGHRVAPPVPRWAKRR